MACSWRSAGALLTVTTVLAGCAPSNAPSPPAGPPVINETFVSAGYPEANLDSMAVWRPAAGSAEVLVTAKATDVLLVFDAVDGRLLRTIGGSGAGPGQFKRPNGIAIEGDLALVVERDNARVQVLSMPAARPIGTFGGDVLRRPYGLAVFTAPDGWITAYITDNYETADEQIPADAELGRRVHQFRIRVTDDALEAEHLRAFGDTSGAGVLRKVETIGVDPTHNRVLVAEEHEAVRDIKVYTLDGRFTGQVIPNTLFQHEPEGLAMYPCGDDGFWVATDQHPDENVFHVLDRRTLALRGSFRGERTRQTDGIALTSGTLGSLNGGAVYAAHVDAHVSAFAWDGIARAVALTSGGCW